MLHRLINSLFFLFFAAAQLYSQKISGIEVKGEKIFTKDNYLQWSGFNTGAKYIPGIEDTIKKNLSFNLGARGYFNSQIAVENEKRDTSGVRLIISVKENEPTYLRRTEIVETDSITKKECVPFFSFSEEKIFIASELETPFSNILSYYENHGYPFTRISIISIQFEKDTIKNKNYADVFFKVNKELVGIINKIEIKGNKNTKDEVILRAIGISKGSEYVQKQVELIPEKLNRLKFFEPVRQPSFMFNSKREGILSIEVKEKQTNSFDGIIGYMPGSNNKGGYVTGLVNVGFTNLFGTGRGASIRWQKLDRLSQELELKYLEPWLIGIPANLNLGYLQKKQDSTYIKTQFNFSLEYMTTDELSASAVVGLETVVPSDNGGSVFTVYNSSSVTTGISIKADTRDDPYAPQKGVYFLNTYTYSRKKISGPEQFLTADVERNIILQRIKVDLGVYYSPVLKQVIALGLHGRELQGKTFEVSDLYLLGGTNSLRGYVENQFMGSRIIWANFEYRLLLTQRSFAFLFCDNGYYFRKAEPDKSILETSGYKTGYGVGMNIETGLGIMTVSYALAKGDTFSQGKIHFGLVNDF